MDVKNINNSTPINTPRIQSKPYSTDVAFKGEMGADTLVTDNGIIGSIRAKAERYKALKALTKNINSTPGFIRINDNDIYESTLRINDKAPAKDIKAKNEMFDILKLDSKYLLPRDCVNILTVTTAENLPLVKQLYCDDKVARCHIHDILPEEKDEKDYQAVKEIYEIVSKDKDLGRFDRAMFLIHTDDETKDAIKTFYKEKLPISFVHHCAIFNKKNDNSNSKLEILKCIAKRKDIPNRVKSDIIDRTNKYNEPFMEMLLKDYKADSCNLHEVINITNTKEDIESKTTIYKKYKDKMTEEEMYFILSALDSDNFERADKYCSMYDEKIFGATDIAYFMRKKEIKPASIGTLLNSIGKKDFQKLSVSEKGLGIELIKMHKKKSIDEIPPQYRNEILKVMLTANYGMFDVSDTFAKHFPLVPRTQKKYCKFIPQLAKSVENIDEKVKDGVATNVLLKNVTEHPVFQELNNSDKKVIMLSTLIPDTPSNYEVYKFAQQYELNDDEKYKLLALHKTRNWVENADTSVNMTQELQNTAYDLRFDNLADMAIIRAEAEGKLNKQNSEYKSSLKNKVFQLKKSQPILPTTKIPKASRINESITRVNADGSTNIKGVYKKENGLVVLKYNEVEDWEKIGFPAGSKSRGIKTREASRLFFNKRINTGNIKFIVHGLDYENQLVKFSAFNLVDSDALLSASYTERPESKYRFFRPKGVILDVDTRDIHGGGDTDSGSGYKKTVDGFKAKHICGLSSELYKEREFLSDLVKRATGLSDNEYVDFVEKNRNKPFQEIEPKEIQEKMIKAYSKINSNRRKGDRAYNEIYVSNPKVNGVFAYSDKNHVGHPIEFLNEKKGLSFLEKFALERDIPMIIFGD